MRISIIVPIYKVDKYINDCILSLKSQCYSDIEYVLIDDGSPDSSASISEEYLITDNHFISIHKCNGGLSDARNSGIALERGEYISFIDSDDIIANDFVTTLDSAVKTKNPILVAAELACFNDGELPSIASTNRTFLKYKRYSAYAALDNPDSKRGLWANVWNKLYHKALFEDFRFPAGKLHEDEYVSYKLYHKAKELIYIDKVIYFYRQRPSGIMGQNSIRHIDALEAFYNRLEFVQEHYTSLYPREMVGFCISCWNLYADYYFSNPDWLLDARKRILELRRKARIPFRLLACCSWKSKYYILRSHPALMHLTCMIFRRFKKINYIYQCLIFLHESKSV